jgi:very-short-patch-repair endonuclease
MSDHLHNRPELRDYRKELRKNLTPAEAALWKLLKHKNLEGRKFRRQHSIGAYIVDFYCAKERLVIEFDGAQHFTASGVQNDQERDAFLENLGIRVLRFENHLIHQATEGVIEMIIKNFKAGREKNLVPAALC